MELKSLTVRGFRRFSGETNLNLEGKLVALLGPNEAGKTSLLHAIASHQSNAAIALTDNSYASTSSPEIALSYFLDIEDVEAAGIEGRTWFRVTKKSDGKLNGKLDRIPARDVSRRTTCATAYESARSALLEADDSSKLIRQWREKMSDDFGNLLSLRTDAYDRTAFQQIEALKADIDGAGFAQLPELAEIMTALSTALEGLLDFERRHDPHREAVNKLLLRQPRILEFTEEYRDLQLPYDIRLKQDAKKPRNPSKPLQELMDRVGLNLDELIAAEARQDRASRQGLLAEANERLKTDFSAWSQSDARLQFDLEGSKLDILVLNTEGFKLRHGYKALSTRSTGYRQFIALQIFTLLNEISGATLLIDELEHHLHYDAQADVVQMLTEEARIGKVIYATHSAGCLPEDLASGVKLVRWKASDRQQSEVINRFWAIDNAGGLAPLLLGMGAATMSFIPTRRALIGEGATEMLLLPKMLKEALGTETLGFQILHGLSNFNLSGIPVLDKAAARAAFLTDNDDGGANLKNHLLKAGVHSRYIFSVGDPQSVLTIEDLIDEAVWWEAVSAVNAQSQSPAKIAALPHKGRVAVLPATLQSRKIDIAYEILDHVIRNPEAKITARQHLDGLRELAKSVDALFRSDDTESE
jgi:predicted ATP-dependent endonuclease of OLD family